jgi:hypothetical protein
VVVRFETRVPSRGWLAGDAASDPAVMDGLAAAFGVAEVGGRRVIDVGGSWAAGQGGGSA